MTRGLEGSATEPPHWSRFFRTVETRNATVAPVMTGADGKPLLLLSRYGEGRVALLLSDHIWLWARGYEGGGPHLDLLRRMSHWLMKQPDLDEEALRLQVQGHDLVVLRQTMADSVAPVTVTSPTGATRQLTLSESKPGTWRSTVPANELGLWQATDGTLKALINVGPTNPKEFSEVTSTTDMLKPLAQATGGDARRVVDGSSIELPRIVPVRASSVFRRRRLDGRANARCQRRQGRRRAAVVRRPDRPAAAARRFCSHLAARRTLTRRCAPVAEISTPCEFIRAGRLRLTRPVLPAMLYCNVGAAEMPWLPTQGPIGMKWFRSNIKHGSRLALLALAIQFVLSFGHFHGVAAQAAPAIQSGPSQSGASYASGLPAPNAVDQAAQQQPASDRDSDQQPADNCAICAVMALANTVLFATPPVLLLPQAVEFLYQTTDAEFVHLNSARVAFQPRAPPVS